MGKMSRVGNDLYNGHKSFDFVSKKALWYGVSLVLVALAVVVVFAKGLNYGIEFTGGTQYRVVLDDSSQVNQENADALRNDIGNASIEGAESPVVNTAGSDAFLIQVGELTPALSDDVVDVITATVGEADISQDEIGASWGAEVAERALLGVAVFLVLVTLFIWGYFREWKMSIAALIALFHDIAITVGIYALSGFPVTPSAVTGLLAILGFSLYDTVVVFDKVRENTQELRKPGQTYADAANLAVNQTLVRSINTGIVALIPIGAILYVSVVQLGASSLQDLALSQFVGMAVGIYSSVLIAPRILVHLKSGEDAIKLSDRRAKSKAKASADRYADVPAITNDLPPERAPRGDELEMDDYELEYEDDENDAPVSRPTAPPRGSEASGRGRVVPPAKGAISDNNPSGRSQPQRQPRSQRGKPGGQK